MGKQRTRLILIALAGFTAGWWFWERREEPLTPEEQVRQVILEGEHALEREDVRGCMRLISRDYRDGVFTYFDVQRGLLHAFREADNVDLTIRQVRVQFSSDHQEAQASMRVNITATTLTGPRRYDDLPVTVDLQREGRRWKVTRVVGWVDITE